MASNTTKNTHIIYCEEILIFISVSTILPHHQEINVFSNHKVRINLHLHNSRISSIKFHLFSENNQYWRCVISIFILFRILRFHNSISLKSYLSNEAIINRKYSSCFINIQYINRPLQFQIKVDLMPNRHISSLPEQTRKWFLSELSTLISEHAYIIEQKYFQVQVQGCRSCREETVTFQF